MDHGELMDDTPGCILFGILAVIVLAVIIVASTESNRQEQEAEAIQAEFALDSSSMRFVYVYGNYDVVGYNAGYELGPDAQVFLDQVTGCYYFRVNVFRGGGLSELNGPDGEQDCSGARNVQTPQD